MLHECQRNEDADDEAAAHKIDIGAVFNCVPRDHLSVKNFRPESRELVFDIDLSDYDDVRTCCQVGDAAWK